MQTASALCAGCTSATLTNPLDVVKTRLQVSADPALDPLPCICQHRQLRCRTALSFTWALTWAVALSLRHLDV